MTIRCVARARAAGLAVWLLAAGAASAQRPDFSGTWHIDQARSSRTVTPRPDADRDAPPPPPPPPNAAVPHVVRHREPILTIQEGPSADVLRLTTDGKEAVNRYSGGRINRSTTRWDGESLVTKWTLEDNGRTLAEGVDVRRLAENGNVLIDERTIKWPAEDVVARIVMTRVRN